MHSFTASLSSSADCSENIDLWAAAVTNPRVKVVVSLCVVVVAVHAARGIDPYELSNIIPLLAFEFTQAVPDSFCLNDVAPQNTKAMFVTLDTPHFEISPLNDVAETNMLDISLTLDTSHFDISPSNDVDPENIKAISVTLDTSHFEMSALKCIASENK